MQKTFAPIKKDIDNLSKNMGAFDKRIKDQMVPLEEKLTQTRNDLAALDKALKAATAASVSRDALSLEILKVKKAYQQQVTAETSALRKQTGILVERLERLEGKLRDLQRTPASAPRTGPASGTGIQEQNLQ